MKPEIDTQHPILVTGASGYVAGWIVRELLEAGAIVHAAVRNPDDTQKVGHLTAMAADAPGTIRFFKADLLEPGSYADAMVGCRVVLHTASPFTIRVRDPQKALIEPAVQGTRNVLEQADATPSVQRVVLTSSCAAIYGDNADIADAPDGVLTEAVWNTTSSLQHQPYSYSKTLAEREAWKITAAQSRWKLVVVNPSLVIGPGTQPRPTSESFNLVRQIGDGSMKMGAPRIGIGAVDVRDLARAHVAAAFLADAQGRNIISAHDTDFVELAASLLDRYGADYPIPRRALPKWLVWLVGPFNGLSRRFVARNVDIAWHADNTKAPRELGLTYRPLQESMQDMFEQMIEAGYFHKARSSKP